VLLSSVISQVPVFPFSPSNGNTFDSLICSTIGPPAEEDDVNDGVGLERRFNDSEENGEELCSRSVACILLASGRGDEDVEVSFRRRRIVSDLVPEVSAVAIIPFTTSDTSGVGRKCKSKAYESPEDNP